MICSREFLVRKLVSSSTRFADSLMVFANNAGSACLNLYIDCLGSPTANRLVFSPTRALIMESCSGSVSWYSSTRICRNVRETPPLLMVSPAWLIMSEKVRRPRLVFMLSQSPQASAQNLRSTLRNLSSSSVNVPSNVGVIATIVFGLSSLQSAKVFPPRYCFNVVKGCPFWLLA